MLSLYEKYWAYIKKEVIGIIEKEVLYILKELDMGDMAGAHWPPNAIIKKFDIEPDKIKEFFKGLEAKGLVSLEGGAPCVCITAKGKEATEV